MTKESQAVRRIGDRFRMSKSYQILRSLHLDVKINPLTLEKLNSARSVYLRACFT